MTEFLSILPTSLGMIPKDSTPLGCPIPYDPHAVSVSLPLWMHVVGYEEGDALVCNQLAIGYPRFKIHIFHEIITQKLMDDYEEDNGNMTCMVVPSKAVASRCVSFLQFNSSEFVAMKPIEGTAFYGVYFDAKLKSKAKSYWQHAGEIISSRQCVEALVALGIEAPPLWYDGQVVASSPEVDSQYTSSENSANSLSNPYKILKERILSIILSSDIAKCINLSDSDREATVTITLSGMAAIFSTLRLFQALSDKGVVVVFGFPYLDTLKIMQRPEWNPDGCIFLGHGDGDDLAQLKNLLEKHNGKDSSLPRIKALFTEFPTNPLLKCPDLARIMELANTYDFLVAVDDTISSYCNVDLTGTAKVDVICTSLTKIFSGIGNVLAGGLVINPFGRHADKLRSIISSDDLEITTISEQDAMVLDFNSRDFRPRVFKCSSNALELAKRLKRDHRVRKIYYPGVRDDDKPDPIYRSLMRNDPNAGYGCLLSILLHDETAVPAFFDNLRISKGPSLGTNFTLSCPYTLLAHYQELPWAANYGVDKYIVRVSVGLEDIEDIWQRFLFALDAACGSSNN